MAFFGQKQWVNLLGKMAIFRLFELLVSVAEKGHFSFQNIVKDIFLAYIASKKVGKMAIFGRQPWVNRFGKMSIFRLFELVFFYSLERRFFVLEYRKRHFSGLDCFK